MGLRPGLPAGCLQLVVTSRAVEASEFGRGRICIRVLAVCLEQFHRPAERHQPADDNLLGLLQSFGVEFEPRLALLPLHRR